MIYKKILAKYHVIIVFIAFLFLIQACAKRQGKREKLRICFDIDNTIMITSDKYSDWFKGEDQSYSARFWEALSSSDKGFKKKRIKALKLLKSHQEKGDIIFFFTSRSSYPDGQMKELLHRNYNIPKKRIYFKVKNWPRKLKKINIDKFYCGSKEKAETARQAGIEAYQVNKATVPVR